MNSAPWSMLIMTLSSGRGGNATLAPHALGAARTAAAWNPWLPDAPLTGAEQGDTELDLKRARHGYRLGPENALLQVSLFDALLARGDREVARTVALRYRGHEAPVLALESETLLSRLEAFEGRFEAALERAMHALQDTGVDGYALNQLLDLAWHAIEFAQLPGRERQIADQLVSALILHEPIVVGRADDLTRTAVLCVAASPALSQRCIARLNELIDAGYFRNSTGITQVLQQVVTLCTAGEIERAAQLLRPLSATAAVRERPLAWLIVHVFDHVGSTDLADEVDRAITTDVGEFNGASLADVRRARRHAQDDLELAAQLAAKVSTPGVTPTRRRRSCPKCERSPSSATERTSTPSNGNES